MSDELPRGRSVSLVVMEEGGVVGVLAPFQVETPWWPDVVPIVAEHPDLVVLRLLEATPAPGSIVGGNVTYLAEVRPESPSIGRTWHGVQEWRGALAEDPLRLPWATPGGPARDLEWVAGHVRIIGTPSQYRTWNLSSVWSIPTTDGEVWLKCVPPFLRHEAAVLDVLRGHAVPQVLAAEDHRILLAAMPGENGYHASFEERCGLIDLLVELQVACRDRLPELLDRGVPDRRWPALLEAATSVIDRRLPHDPMLRKVVETADRRVEMLADCGLPDVLVHGDAHGGNARIGDDLERGMWFDWGDARVGHPLLDVAVLERPGIPDRDALIAHWMDVWRSICPGSDPHRAWSLARPLAALGDAVVYQNFLDQIEVTERCYHEGDVIPCLERAAAAAAAELS